jgi:hypothetical protein
VAQATASRIHGPSIGTPLQQLQRLHGKHECTEDDDNEQYMNVTSEEGASVAAEEFRVETASMLPRRLTFGFEDEEENKGEEKRVIRT